MALPYITLDAGNIDNEHICCAFSDKKCQQGYQMKKDWLKQEFDKGYIFRWLDARAKVFIEYGPAETAWVPVDAPNYLWMNCFWVSGQYKGCGHAKALLASAMDDATRQNRYGLATVAGRKKNSFYERWCLVDTAGVRNMRNLAFRLLSSCQTPNPGRPSPGL